MSLVGALDSSSGPWMQWLLTLGRRAGLFLGKFPGLRAQERSPGKTIVSPKVKQAQTSVAAVVYIWKHIFNFNLHQLWSGVQSLQRVSSCSFSPRQLALFIWSCQGLSLGRGYPEAAAGLWLPGVWDFCSHRALTCQPPILCGDGRLEKETEQVSETGRERERQGG